MSSPAVSKSAPPPDRGSAVPMILKLVCEFTGMRLALVARVTDQRWTTCAIYDRMSYGLAVGDRLDMGTTCSADLNGSAQAPAPEAAGACQLPRKHAAPHPARVGSCISIPIRQADGQLFGTLCVLDRKPVTFKPDLNDTLLALAELIEHQLTTESERQACDEELKAERESSRAREEFIAVLGHDLRNPLSGIAGAAAYLEELESGPDRDEMLGIIRNSAQQINHLIEDVLDFARGRRGAGIPLERRRDADLAVLASVAINELCASHPGRSVHLRHSGPVIASVDSVRMRQLLSNLIGNALQHSPPEKPVTIKLDQIGKDARIAITNGGPPLSAENASSLFSPFACRPNRSSRSGLGLGLFIASEIARAHGGSIKVSSGKRGTTLTTLLPCENALSDCGP